MPPANREAFFHHLCKAEALANVILQKNKRDKDGRYFLATSYGLRSSFAITIDHSLRSAYSFGAKAYSLARQLIEEDPEYYDAYLIAGVYEYVVGSIPWYLKWAALILGHSGNKQDGLRYLKLASEKGQYICLEAQTVLMVLYVYEKLYGEAFRIAHELSANYPRNFLLPLCAAQIARMAGLKEQAASLLLQVERRIEAKQPNFDKIPLETFRYDLGCELVDMGMHDKAYQRFKQAVDDPVTPERQRALSHLRLGQILQWQGNNLEAAQHYRKVLALRDVENSHSQARKWLRKLGIP